MAAKTRRWTPEEVSQLNKLIKAGNTNKEIAAILGRTHRQIINKRTRKPTTPKSESRQGTLCWYCRKATNGGCSWGRSLTPVEGWTAKPVSKSNYNGGQSYLVSESPEFEEG